MAFTTFDTVKVTGPVPPLAELRLLSVILPTFTYWVGGLRVMPGLTVME